jgi:hypothetical protein
MVKREHLPLKQAEPVQLPLGDLMLAFKASSVGLTPIQCPFFSVRFHFITHCSAHNSFSSRTLAEACPLSNDEQYIDIAARHQPRPGCTQYLLSWRQRLPVTALPLALGQ